MWKLDPKESSLALIPIDVSSLGIEGMRVGERKKESRGV
jgi:hypothetical protein